MKALMTIIPAVLMLALYLPAAAARPDPSVPSDEDGGRNSRCATGAIHGRYLFTASGFTRMPDSAPGTPWVPKAIVEVLQFDGHGQVSTLSLTVANPFGDTGNVIQAPSGAPGEYTIKTDCTGTVHFFDANNVTFSVAIDGNGIIHMIQTNPNSNVFAGDLTRIW